MHDPMGDITNPGATRDQGAHGHARSGMELLTWRYTDDEWQRHLQARDRRKWLASLSVRKWLTGFGRAAPRRPFPTRAVAIGGAFAAGFVAAVIADSPVGIGITALGLVGTVITHLASKWQPTDLVDAPQVLFTSTGVIFGEHARRWRGYRYKLDEVRVRIGELDQVEPAYLELEFSSGWRETTISIPVPTGLEQDAHELAGRLEDMMLGRELGPAANNAPPVTHDHLKHRD